MAMPTWDAATSLTRLQAKVKRAQSLSARWSETVANSLSVADGLRKRLEQDATARVLNSQNGNKTAPAAGQHEWLVQLPDSLDSVCENLEACFDQVDSLQNALDDAADLSEGLDAQVSTLQQQVTLSRQEITQLRSVLESNRYKDLLDPSVSDAQCSSPTSPSSSIEQLKNVVEILQVQLQSAQELLAERRREVQLLERRISNQSEAVVGLEEERGSPGGRDDDEGLPTKAVVEVLQTQIKSAQEQLAEKDTEVKRLERRLSSIPSRRTSGWSSMGNFASFTGADMGSEGHHDGVSELDEEREDDLSPVSVLRASKEVLQSQFAAAKEVLAAKEAEIEALKADRQRLQAQVSTLQQRLSNVQVVMLQQQLDKVDPLV